MPNWCKNGLHVEGDKAEVQRFKDGIKRTDEKYEIISSYVPCPDALQEIKTGFATINEVRVERWTESGEGKERVMEAVTPAREAEFIKLYGAADWYQWAVSNWGTKWSDCDTELESEYSGYLCFMFDSPWGSPHKAFDKIAKLFPKLKFILKYGQGETEFEGYVIWKNGERVKEDEWEWNGFDLSSSYVRDDDNE